MAKAYTPTLDDIKALRKRTGVGINDVKEALVAAAGDMDKAIEELRKKGMAKGAKRAGREGNEGTIGVYVHGDESNLVSLVELNCETDFVARNDEFKQLAKDLAVHVAAMNTEYVSRETVPAEVIEKEREIALEEMKDSKKPQDVMDKILEGKIEKFYKEKCLMEQDFFKDDSLKVQDLINEALAKIGEKIEVSRILTWRVGE